MSVILKRHAIVKSRRFVVDKRWFPSFSCVAGSIDARGVALAYGEDDGFMLRPCLDVAEFKGRCVFWVEVGGDVCPGEAGVGGA